MYRRQEASESYKMDEEEDQTCGSQWHMSQLHAAGRTGASSRFQSCVHHKVPKGLFLCLPGGKVSLPGVSSLALSSLSLSGLSPSLSLFSPHTSATGTKWKETIHLPCEGTRCLVLCFSFLCLRFAPGLPGGKPLTTSSKDFFFFNWMF